jgi:tetratricopeptide (TPR) repeat protein
MPTFMPIRFALARAYYGDHQVKKAIAVMEEVVKADPANAQNANLLMSMLAEDGQIDRAKQLMEGIPAGTMDVNTLLNVGIGLMNKKQPGAAVAYFTKAIAADPKSHLGYYYRGLAYLQENKPKDAKPDLLKVVELGPDSDEAKEAKDYLKSIK